MTIQISGTTVIDQNRYIQNIQAYYGPGIASQAEAQAGTNNDQLMTPLRVKQSVLSNGLTTVINRIQRGSTTATSPNAQVPWQSYPQQNAPAPSGTTNVSLSSVNTGKAFVSQGNRGQADRVQTSNPSYSAGFGFDGSNASARLTSGTNISITTGQSKYGTSPGPGTSGSYTAVISCTVDWEVIEFK